MKQSIAVVALHTKEGTLIPLFVVWDNHVKYPIDRIIKKERGASRKHGGIGLRYTVKIQGQMRWLTYENPGWFIEKLE